MAQRYRVAQRSGATTTIPWDYGETYHAVLQAEGVAASTPYVLVDLSDTTNFPHSHTGAVVVKNLRLHAEKAADGVYDIWVGVVSENDATDGTADWFHVFHLQASGNPTDSTDRFAQQISYPSGLNTYVVGGALQQFVTNIQQAGHTNWQNDVYRTSPAGTVQPAVGDIVMWVEEVSGTGTIDFFVSIDYDTL